MIEQHLQNIENYQHSITEEVQAIRDLLSDEEFARITNAYWKNGRIVVEFETNVDINIHYWFGDKVHEVEDYVGEIDESKGTFEIGVNQFDKPWNVQVVGDRAESEVWNVGQLPSDTTPVETNLPDGVWHGLWDSWNYSGDEFNTVKVPNPPKAKESLDDGKNVIVSFSHRWKKNGEKLSREKWESIISGWGSTINELDPERTIILIQDEPLSNHHGFTVDEIEFLYSTFKKAHPDHRFAYSLTRQSLRRRVPEGLKMDVAILPLYLFSGEQTKQGFDSYFDQHISIARQKMGADIFIIGQGFYNQNSDRKDWAKPPVEAPGWYAEAIQRNNIKGLIWWVYSIKRDDTVGLEEMPDYFERIKDL